jgi:hypothetical protein
MTENEALAKARAMSEELGWGWDEPVSVGIEVDNGKNVIRIVTNCNYKGGNAWFRFDQVSGELLRRGVWPQ